MNNMNIVERYVVYELNPVMGSEKHMALQKVEFTGWQHNSFDTEAAAIEALAEKEMTYTNYIILKQVHIN